MTKSIMQGKLFDIEIEGGEIDEVIFNDESFERPIKLINKIGKKIIITIVSNVPVVQFKEKKIVLGPKESIETTYTILSNLIETDLNGRVIFTSIINSQRDEIVINIHLICGKER